MPDPDGASQAGRRPNDSRPQNRLPKNRDRLALYRRLIRSAADRVRWACTLEAVAPKFGNVHPSAAFVDLQLCDFMIAGEQLAAVIEESAGWSVGRTILEAVRRCRERTGTNVNLGIALLIVPLVRAEHLAQQRSCGHREAMQEVLEGLDEQDGKDVYTAIRLAQPGGLGQASEMDVNELSAHGPSPVDLLAAMRSATDRDAIARQYATGFAEFYDSLVPLIDDAIGEAGDVLIGIREAQLRLLARAPDTLIARKCGLQTAAQAQTMAAEVLGMVGDAERADAETRFDAWLRGDGHRRNPGTTADFIAAGLYVLLSEHPSWREFR